MGSLGQPSAECAQACAHGLVASTFNAFDGGIVLNNPCSRIVACGSVCADCRMGSLSFASVATSSPCGGVRARGPDALLLQKHARRATGGPHTRLACRGCGVCHVLRDECHPVAGVHGAAFALPEVCHAAPSPGGSGRHRCTKASCEEEVSTTRPCARCLPPLGALVALLARPPAWVAAVRLVHRARVRAGSFSSARAVSLPHAPAESDGQRSLWRCGKGRRSRS